MATVAKKKKQAGVGPSTGSDDLFQRSLRAVWLLLGGIGLLMFFWMSQSPRPYDDDNIGRYFMAQYAPHNSAHFVDLWGRPLGILLYLIPSQFGYWYCAGTTVLLSLGTIYFVYRTAVITDRPNAWLAVVFTAFQPIFFSTSFSLCTEPIAAFFMAIGMYYYYKGRYVPGTLLLSLMPLARLELVVVLPFFAVELIRSRRYMPILLLGFGLVALQVAGMIIRQDPLYLWTMMGGAAHGMYQNGPFDHYFKRFIFIVGPTLFVYLLYRLYHDILERRVNVLNVSVVALFALHVYFYWKGNVAQIGFLRHFVAIAPMISLVGLDGFNRWLACKNAGTPEKDDRWMDFVFLALLTIVTLVYYSFNLVGDYFLSEEKDYLKFLIVLLVLLLFVFNRYLRMTDRAMKRFITVVIAATAVGYTLVKQAPLKLAPEHVTVKNFYDYYEHTVKPQQKPMMVVHTWFFFFDNFNYYQERDSSSTIWTMRRENLEKLPVGGLVAWDSHYSWRLVSDVQQEDLVNNPKFKLNRQFVSPDRRFGILLFEKVKT